MKPITRIEEPYVARHGRRFAATFRFTEIPSVSVDRFARGANIDAGRA